MFFFKKALEISVIIVYTYANVDEVGALPPER